MMRRVCDYCGKPAIYELRLTDHQTIIDTCRDHTGNAIGIGVDNMSNTHFDIRWIGAPE